jgi:hypothetical protein
MDAVLQSPIPLLDAEMQSLFFLEDLLDIERANPYS